MTVLVDSKTFPSFSKLVMEYTGMKDMLEINRLILTFHKGCSDDQSRKNKNMFINYLVNTQAYTNHARSVFATCARSLGIEDSSVEDMYKAFLKTDSRATGIQVHPMTSHGAAEYIASSPQFSTILGEICIELIRAEYPELKDSAVEIPPSVVRMIATDKRVRAPPLSSNNVWAALSEELERDNSWAFEQNTAPLLPPTQTQTQTQTQPQPQLQSPTSENCKEVQTAGQDESSISRRITERYKHHMSADPTEEELRAMLRCTGSVETMVDTFVAAKQSESSKTIDPYALIDVFETVYERSITVFEYMKMAERHKYSDVSTMKKDIRDSKEKYIDAMHAIDEIHKHYTGEVPDRYVLTRRFVTKIDDSAFQHNLIDSIVQGSYLPGMYETHMRTCIASAYKETYDVPPEEHDIAYMFTHAQQQKLHSASHDLQSLITDIKERTDKHLECMKQVFLAVVGRSPDQVETVELLAKYREDFDATPSKPTNYTDASIKDMLYASLEYHEVLRDKLKGAYEIKHTSPPMPSTLYRLLSRALADEQAKRMDVNGLVDWI